MDGARKLAELIERAQPCVVLSGAGMSTESGIPDFRSAAGLWADLDPFEVASIDAFRRNPAKVWSFYRRRLDVLGAAKPNAGHIALAGLESAGLVAGIVTQNVDTLHEQAGSRRVIEIHGSLRSAVCTRCGASVTREEVAQRLARADVPMCERCDRPLKPGVVMFGEMLSPDAIEAAEQLARDARLMLVVGSSLQVWPVAGLPQLTLEAGGELAILNRDETTYDDEATLVVHAAAGETLAQARDLLLAGKMCYPDGHGDEGQGR